MESLLILLLAILVAAVVAVALLRRVRPIGGRR